MHIQWLDIIIRFMCISPIQRPHYIPSSYTYQFFEKSYFIIVLHKISCSRQFESELSLHSLASLFPIKEGSTSHLGLLPSGKKRKTALRCSEPLRYKVGGASKPSPWLCGMRPPGCYLAKGAGYYPYFKTTLACNKSQRERNVFNV